MFLLVSGVIYTKISQKQSDHHSRTTVATYHTHCKSPNIGEWWWTPKDSLGHTDVQSKKKYAWYTQHYLFDVIGHQGGELEQGELSKLFPRKPKTFSFCVCL